ncbi:imelysin family protein [Croceitalea rosinachiae]|uniref:Imelysin family protein n=1 Tax=Croceitalea rosinachiae TaxID=3075596 RepID=A0ABU3AEA3_9FLAO|nr:imelysin family protein [Croceitalea sp. F388]MDT0608235.1 imelysin family protein [Croceitalea sp. F388]
MKKYWYVLSVLFLVLWACSSDNTDETPMTDDDISMSDDDGGMQNVFDRSTLLVNWADNIIIPSYKSFQTTMAQLVIDYESFEQEPILQNLQTLRTSWLNAYKSWQSISMFEIGPAEAIGLRLNVNTYPTDVMLVEMNIANGGYNFDLSSNRDAKGFPALDYLLNGFATDDLGILEKFTTDAQKDANLLYLKDVINNIKSLTDSVIAEWEGDYRAIFVNNDGSSATASVDRFSNDFVFYYEKFLRAGKMGIPLGVFSGIQSPNTIESFYSPENSNELFLEGLDAVQNFFNGASLGESMASYLTTLDRKDLADDINAQFDAARTAVEALDSFRTELETNNPSIAMLSAYDEVQKAVSLLKVDMFSAMSISIDFVDADGD